MTRPILPTELNYTCYTVLLSDLAHIPAVSQGNGHSQWPHPAPHQSLHSRHSLHPHPPNLPQHTSAQAESHSSAAPDSPGDVQREPKSYQRAQSSHPWFHGRSQRKPIPQP
ncbi:hypothetical protein GBAR_LOCUS25457 [Geodia barretti]|uniref:Uncharacterized protein n=1 Tax=Geodia barretti TaxID=519541 RepID=A0AA35X6H9_GEOBA|nr:hypothetical protein GBAR_LOCUS25457 [Geodia barretti]